MIAIKDEGRLGVLEEYLSRFKYSVKISKNKARWLDRKQRAEILGWTRNSCGVEYKDWFAHVGSMQDPLVHFGFINQARANWFALKWSEYVGNE